MTTITPTINLSNVTKNFGLDEALSNVSLTLNQGEFILVTGPNGSGKTTLLKVIGGILSTDVGTITKSNSESSYFSPNSLGLYEDLTAADNLSFFGDQNVEASLSEWQITKLKNKKIKSLSLGERIRVALARVFNTTSAATLLLDEPTVGLDDDAKKILLAKLSKHSGLVVISTHDAELFNSNLTREVKLSSGKIASDKTIKEAKSSQAATRTIPLSLLSLIKKDLKLELSARESILSLFNFSILLFVFIAIGLSIAIVSQETIQRIYPVLFWVFFLLISLLSADRSFGYEVKNGAINSLISSGTSPSTIFVAKWFSLTLLLILYALFQRALGAVLLEGDIASPGTLLILVSAATSALATLFSTISTSSRLGSIVLPLLALPTLSPLFMAATEISFDGLDRGPWLSLLIGLNILYFTLGFNLYKYGVKE